MNKKGEHTVNQSIEYRFTDIVKVAGYDNNLFFEVVGQTYHERVPDAQAGIKGEQERIYHLVSLGKLTPYIANPKDMVLIVSQDVSKDYMKMVDELLDLYNTYIHLYHQLQDHKYKIGADGIMCLLRQKAKEGEKS